MEHKTLLELQQLLNEAVTKVAIGGRYRHYKDANKIYVVTGLCVLEETDEVAVKYAMTTNPEIEFVRAAKLWLEYVDWEGKPVLRFTKVD